MHIYRVEGRRVHHSDPLHVGRFYPASQRQHRRSMKDRQDLILYLASLHASASRSGRPLGFCEIPIRLTSLREWVYDYRVALDRFFDVRRTGYRIGDLHDLSVITPKVLDAPVTEAVGRASRSLRARVATWILPDCSRRRRGPAPR